MNWMSGYSFAVGILYVLPAVIGFLRFHRRRWAILMLTLSLGWTVVGWIVALIWSISGRR